MSWNEEADMATRSRERGNQTPDTPGFSETELADLKVDELRQRAKEQGVSGASGMRKDELVKAVAKAYKKSADDTSSRGRSEAKKSGGSDSSGHKAAARGRADSEGGARRGKSSSKSLKYAQEITSPEEEPDRAGRSLVTTNHDVIRQWADERGGVPATIEGTEHEDHLGVLRIDFPGRGGGGRLREVSWDEWFDTFDERQLNFIYQEETSDGRQSNFFRLENPNREDA
ncbi:MAG TPA: Rho termination factor N-terminal domain-containing protein [Micromonosporaceae bacterium]